jgi:hypothetical protein
MKPLLVLSVLLAVFGTAVLSQATQGVGLLAQALFLAVLARIAQAARQHEEAMKRWEGLEARTRGAHEPPESGDGNAPEWPNLVNPD